MSAVAHKDLWHQNLAKPEGMMGEVVGEYFTKEFHEINMWAVHSLQVQPGERILEIGFGPGVAIEELARTTSAEYIAGIDYSELMVKKAKKRNVRSVEQGRVDLRHANVADLPDFGTSFDKIVVINNIMYWPDTVESLRKVGQHLNANGLITLIIQRNDEMYRQGQCQDEVGWYVNCLRQAGFANVGVFAQPVTLERKQGQSLLAGIAIYGFRPMPYQVFLQDAHVRQCEQLWADMFRLPSGASSVPVPVRHP